MCAEVFGNQLGLVDWFQPNHICETGVVLSRTDRVYVNQHLVVQLDKKNECIVIRVPDKLSDHSLLAFSRRTAVKSKITKAPIPRWALEHPEYPSRVQGEYATLLHLHPLQMCGINFARTKKL